MVLLLAIQFVTFLVIVFFGVFVFFKNPRASVNRAFALFALGVAGWSIAIFLTIIWSSLMWGRLAFAFASLWTAGLLWFVHLFPEPTTHWKAWRNTGMILGTIFFVVPASSLMIKSVTIIDGHITGDLAPLPYLLWDAFFLCSLLYAMIRSWVRTARAKGLARNQLRSLSIGITGFLLPFLTTNILFPLLLNDFRWNNLGPLFTLFLIVFVAHAVITYRFLSIRWVIKKSVDILLLWIFLFGVIWSTFALLEHAFSVTIIHVVTSGILAIVTEPVLTMLSRWSARMSSRGSYVFDDAVSHITEAVHGSLELPALQKTLADLLQKYFGFSRLALVALSTDNLDAPVKSLYRGFTSEILGALPSSVNICTESQQPIIEASELQWRLANNVSPVSAKRDREVLKFMRAFGVASMMPFCVGEGSVGMAFFGERPNNAPLSDQDIALLNVTRGSAAPAMANGVRVAEMKRLYAQLLDLDKTKSEFIDIVAHHFRTPLTSILWNVELSLEKTHLDPSLQETLQQIRQRAGYLNVTLNRIFDLLALENRQLRFERNPLDLREIVRAVLEEMKTTCVEKELRAETELLPAMIIGDREKTTSIIRTLLENACRYSHQKGRVRIRLTPDLRTKKILFQVEDHGIGIAEKDLSHIFDKFFRALNALKTVTDGAGISMYLAKRFIEKQRGTVDVRSQLGKGTTITVTFPSVEA